VGPVPELPDILVYLDALALRIVGTTLERARLASPFLVRSVDPPLTYAFGTKVLGLRRLGKRIVLELSGDLFLVIHLMIAGRLRWKEKGAKVPGKLGLAAFDFTRGTLILTEASTRKRASLHLVRGEAALAAFDMGGLEVLDSTIDEFRDALARERHTIKRSLTDPRIFSGIGNAYSDEILHRANLSPVTMSDRLSEEELTRLHDATIATLRDWTRRLREETGDAFPEKVTAFREGMAVHGRYREPCPVCGSPVQRIVHAENESNYCPTCQTGGKLLADRSLSKVLKADWPKTLEELDERLNRDG